MVTSTQTSPTSRKRSAFSRALSVLLLILIVYGTTVEAAHRHGGAAAIHQVSTATLFDSETAKTPGVNLLGCGDCLICQLHQNFSTSLICIREVQTTITVRPQFSEASILAIQSRINLPKAGRAPPELSLS